MSRSLFIHLQASIVLHDNESIDGNDHHCSECLHVVVVRVVYQ